jgi:hypothetical protein
MDLTVGKNVDSWCTRCKLVLAHTIEAITDGKVTRVHCNTCRGRHAYRAAAPGTRVASGRARTSGGNDRAKREPDQSVDQYRALLRGRTEAVSRAYSTSARFAKGELVSHATFGLGVVTGERETTKIDVLFADGPKVLLQGR